MRTIGGIYEVKKAYSHETGRRDLVDDYSGCAAEIISFHDEDALVHIRGIGEVYVNVRRLGKRVRA